MANNHSGASDFHVLIVGAGITGLVIAQGLQKNGIACTVFEAEKSAQDYRPTDWGMGIHWSIPLLKRCLPGAVFDDIESAQVDPFFHPPDVDHIPLFNGETGEIIKRLPLPKVHRVSRRKMRALCARSVKVQYNKKLRNIEAPHDSSEVVALFEDGTSATGTILIGADGARSRVRQQLLGSEGEAETVPSLATRLMVKYDDPAKAQVIRSDSHHINAMAIHPNGTFGWISILDVADQDDPTTWTFQLMTSWKSDGAKSTTTALKEVQKKMAVFAHPFSSANTWIPEDGETQVNVNNISTWQPVPFNNQSGRITLAGDAAHPMTFHRGQGLNHAIADADALVQTLTSIAGDIGSKTQSTMASSLGKGISTYDDEVRKRGGDEVRLSKINTVMMHSWDQLMESPLMKMSANRG